MIKKGSVLAQNRCLSPVNPTRVLCLISACGGASDDWRQRFAKQAIEVMTNHRRVMAALLKQKAGHR